MAWGSTRKTNSGVEGCDERKYMAIGNLKIRLRHSDWKRPPKNCKKNAREGVEQQPTSRPRFLNGSQVPTVQHVSPPLPHRSPSTQRSWTLATPMTIGPEGLYRKLGGCIPFGRDEMLGTRPLASTCLCGSGVSSVLYWNATPSCFPWYEDTSLDSP